MDWTWPDLLPSQIAQCLSELSINLTEDDLRNPEKQKINKVYTVLAEFLTGTSAEELEQPDLQALEVVEYPDLHLKSIQEIARIQAIAKLMRAIGLKNFSVQRDLMKPESKRTIHILSGIINFAKFREEKLAYYNELTVQQGMLLEKRQELLEQQQRLEAQREQLQQVVEAESPTLRELQEATQGLKEELEELNAQQAALQEECGALKDRARRAKGHVADLRARAVAARTDSDRLRGLILDRPEELRGALLALDAEAEAARALNGQTERGVRQLKQRTEALLRLDKEVEKAVALLAQAEAEAARSKAARRELKELRGQHASLLDEQAGAASQRRLLEKEKAIEGQELLGLSAQLEQRQEAHARAVREGREEQAVALARSQNEGAAQVQAHLRAQREVEREMKEREERHRAQLLRMQGQFQTLLAQVAQYHQRLFAALEQGAPLPA